MQSLLAPPPYPLHTAASQGVTSLPPCSLPSLQALRIFKANKVPADVIITPQRNVTPTWLSLRSIYILPAQTRQIQAALKKIGVINAQGLITSDPRKVRRAGRGGMGWPPWSCRWRQILSRHAW